MSDETETLKRSPIYLRQDLHARLKIRAAVEGRKLGELLDEIVESSFSPAQPLRALEEVEA